MGRVLFAAAIAGLVSTFTAWPVDPRRPAQGPQDRPLFSVHAELVVVHVMVTDRRGAPVTGLDVDAFGVSEDGERQAIRFFATPDAPATVGLIIDSSGSMRPVRDRVIAAVAAFADISNPDDDLFALTFNERVASALPRHAPFTGSAQALQEALARVFVPTGRTALHDAIAAGLKYVAEGRHQTRALVVVSDGGDNASTTSFDEIVKAAQVANTLIYTMAIIDPLDRDAKPGRL
jgi:Ca-activated chloride channel family protein